MKLFSWSTGREATVPLKPEEVMHAYHECARVVMAYTFGYRCEKEGLRALTVSSVRCEIDYRNDSFLANSITNYSMQPYLLDSLNSKSIDITTELADRITMILLSGTEARKIYSPSLIDAHVSTIADKEELLSIEQFVLARTVKTRNEFFTTARTHARAMMKLPTIWKAVERVATHYQKAKGGLSRDEIESLLKTCSFWKFVKG